MALQIKCLLPKLGDLSLDPLIHVKAWSGTVFLGSLSAGESETGRSFGFAVQCSQAVTSRFCERLCILHVHAHKHIHHTCAHRQVRN